MLQQVFTLALQNDSPSHSPTKISPLFLFSLLLGTALQSNWTTDKKEKKKKCFVNLSVTQQSLC